MSEFPKFTPGEEKEVVGHIDFKEMDPEVEYEIVPQPFRRRNITLSAGEFELFNVEFLYTEEGERIADIRELVLRGTGLTEHELAAFLIDNGIVPFVSHDILAPISIPKPAPNETRQPNPDPMTHLSDYFPKGMPTARGEKKRKKD